MKARIILSSADFSANNIGRIVELADLTKKVLARQTQYGEDSDEAQALNTFLNTLVDNGFLGGDSPLLKTLVIPGLGANHGQLMYNIASLDQDGYPVNIMPPAEQEAVENKRVYRPILDSSNRIVAMLAYTDDGMESSDVNSQSRFNPHIWDSAVNNQPVPSYSFVYFGHSSKNAMGESSILSENGTQSWTNKRDISQIKSGSAVLVGLSFGTQTGDGFRLMNYDVSGVMDGMIGSTEVTGEQGTAAIFTSTTTYSLFRIGTFVYNVNNQAACSLFAFGNKIPSAKKSVLQSAVSTFLTAIHAI